MFYDHFCAHDRLNELGDLQRYWSKVKYETPFSYAHAEIWSQVVVICGPTHYQLDHGIGNKDNNYVFVVLLIHTLTQYKYIIIKSS